MGATRGVWPPGMLAPLEKLEVALRSEAYNRSLWSPSRMCWSIFRELVTVDDCLRKAMVLWNSVRSSSSSTYSWRTGSLKAAERTNRFPHWLDKVSRASRILAVGNTYACAVPKTLVMIGRFSPKPWKALVLSISALIPFLAKSTTWASMSLWVLVLGWMTGAMTS